MQGFRVNLNHGLNRAKGNRRQRTAHLPSLIHRGQPRQGRSGSKSYIGIRRGRRVWAPLWPRKDGAFIYLPDPDGLHGEQQSPAMDLFQERLRADGLEANWQPTYNAGANPVSIRLRQTDLDKPTVRDLLRATFEILGSGAAPWSEHQAEPLTDTPPATAANIRADGNAAQAG
jgi:hypothetical protein